MVNILNEFELAQLECASPMAQWPKAAADGSAATATPETAVGLLGAAAVDFAIGAIQFHPAAALVADNANNAVITVFARRAAAPAVQVQLAQLTTNVAAGNWTAWAAVNIPLAAGAFLRSGDAITVTITKGGTGVVVPQGVLALYPKVQ